MLPDEEKIIQAWEPVRGPSLPVRASQLVVVLSNYNDAAYLEECLHAIRGQLDERMAVLFIDDASRDASVEIACRMLDGFPQACIVRNPENQGVIKNINAAIQSIRAPYVYFASSNDRIADNFFRDALALLHKHPSAGLISGFYKRIKENGEPQGIIRDALPDTKACYLSAEEVRKTFLTKGPWIVGSSTLYRLQALREIGGFQPDLLSATDSLAATRIALSHGACFLPSICSYWRISDTGFAATTITSPERIEAILEAGNRYFGEGSVVETDKVWNFWSRELLFCHVMACHGIKTEYLSHSLIHRHSGIPMWRLNLLRLPLPPRLWRLLAAGVLASFKFRHYIRKQIAWMWLAGKELKMSA